MTSDPFERLKDNLEDVHRLMEIHREEAGPQPGRKYDVEVLNKSGVVLALACWEAFVEDCAVAAFDHLLAHTTEPGQLPEAVRRVVGAQIRKDQNDFSPWRLAADGWRSELLQFRSDVIRRHVTPINTPSPRNVDRLFQELVGLASMSSNWKWHRMSAGQLTARLDSFISLRGAIAHRSAANRTVTKADVTINVDIILRIAGLTANRVREYLHSQTGAYPWSLKPQPAKPGRPRKSSGTVTNTVDP